MLTFELQSAIEVMLVASSAMLFIFVILTLAYYYSNVLAVEVIHSNDLYK